MYFSWGSLRHDRGVGGLQLTKKTQRYLWASRILMNKFSLLFTSLQVIDFFSPSKFIFNYIESYPFSFLQLVLCILSPERARVVERETWWQSCLENNGWGLWWWAPTQRWTWPRDAASCQGASSVYTLLFLKLRRQLSEPAQSTLARPIPTSWKSKELSLLGILMSQEDQSRQFCCIFCSQKPKKPWAP